MEEHSGEENPLELMLLNFHGDANGICYGTQVDYTQKFIPVGGNRPPLCLPHWSHRASTPQNYFEFFTKNSAFGEGSTANALENMSLPSGSMVIGGDPELQRELLFNNPGSARPSELAGCSAVIGSGCLSSNSYMLNSDNYEVPLNLTCLEQCNEGQKDHMHEILQHQKHSQINQTSWIHGTSSNIGDVSQHRPRVTVAESVFLSKKQESLPRQRKAARDDRQRRTRIAEKICALQELLPYGTKGSQAAVLDNVIDYIKYLQFQMTELLESRLGGEPVYAPLVYLKERGHFLVDGQRNESLEEIMGNLVEENPSAAIKLLESKGFAVAPIALADRFM